MKRRDLLHVLLAAVVLLGAAFTTVSAQKTGIPSRPEQLTFAPLDFEVPDAADYRHQLSNGIPVYVAEDRDLPLVTIAITLRAGTFVQRKPGVASMTGTMLRRGGTSSMTAEEFDERADFLAANISSFSGSTSSGASVNCITPVLDETLTLFFQMLKSPAFEQGRVEIEKDSNLESMKQRNDNPARISGREWNWLMRGRDHFTSRAMLKTDLDSISREDLIDYHKKYWRPANMMIAVSGDVDTKSILARLNEHFSGWKSDGPQVPWPPPAPSHTPTPGVYYVEKDIPQGRVVIGHHTAKRKSWDDPDEFPLMIMNDILGGGGFTSRVVKRIRSDEGLAYSAGTGLSLGEHWPGTFNVRYQSKSPTVAFAAQIALEEIDRIRTEKVSEEEMEVAKGSFVEAFPRRFESAGQIAGIFVDDEYRGRPHDYWKTYRSRVSSVSRDQVQAVAKKYLHPDKLAFLIVGKWEEIEPGDPDNRASMGEFFEGKATRLPLRDPLTLEPIK